MTHLPEAAILLTGSELLDGRVRDRNGYFLSASLAEHGFRVATQIVAGDDERLIAAGLKQLLDLHPAVLVVCGGLGTTHDDLTTAVVATVLRRRLWQDPDALRMVEEATRAACERRGVDPETLMAQAQRQALLPAGSRVVPPAGIAPGYILSAGETTVIVLPGVPTELEAMWPDVVAELAASGVAPQTGRRLVRIYGVGEMQVAPVLESVAYDLVEVGVTAQQGEISVSLTYVDEKESARQAEAIVARLTNDLPVYSADGRSVDAIVADTLRSRAQTVSVAESCTGGLLAARFTDRPGSSDYFVGGVVTYANEAKLRLLGVPAQTLKEHGAVSAETATAMAERARQATGATFGLATTGIAGPSGGSDDKPVGLVFLGCAGPEGTTVRRVVLPGNREAVRAATVTAALHLLREALAP
jgi:nicotinamide-nucleotide amidase